jgi:tetratricopeptide (TPR) repeat protein
VAAALVILTAVAYWPVGGHPFVAYDDGRYVYENPGVLAGLTASGAAWAFTALYASNWHPLTWLSHMADVSLFGLDAGWHHRVNVAWHLLNVALLFAWLTSATRATWRAALVAALFALHPLHVESVAWVAERKDVLSAFFWFLCLLAYLRYVRYPGPGTYLVVAGTFACGLMAKPMVVTLPAILLLVDVWPLGRLRPGEITPRSAWPLVREKLPLFALSALTSAATVVAQNRGGTMWGLEHLPLPLRLANALFAAGSYLGKAVWPASLAVFYPHPATVPGGVPWGPVLLSGALVVGLAALAGWQWRRRPVLAVGLSWYLVALLPVIGIIQVGAQSMADRYTYLPLVGIFIAVAWILPAPPVGSRAWRWTAVVLAAGLLLALSAMTRRQVATWKDTFTLFRHATLVTRDNGLAWKNLGVEYHRQGRIEEATRAFQESLRSRPDDFDTWMNLAAGHAALDHPGAAAAALRRALEIEPASPEAWFNFGIASLLDGRPEVAVEAIQNLRRLDAEKARNLESIVLRARSH